MLKKRDQVFKACDELLAEGKKVKAITMEAIGERLLKLGFKKGSFTTRSGYKRAWKEERGLPDDEKENDIAYQQTDFLSNATALYRESILKDVKEEFEQKMEGIVAQRDTLETEKLALEEKFADLNKRYLALENTYEQSKHKEEAAITAIKNTEKILADTQAHLQIQTEIFEKREADWKKERDNLIDLNQSQLNIMDAAVKTQQAQHYQEIKRLMEIHESQRHEWIAEKDELKTTNHKLTKCLETVKEEKVIAQTKLENQSKKITELEENFIHEKKQKKASEGKSRFQEEKIALLIAENQHTKDVAVITEERYQKIVKSLEDNFNVLLQKIDLLQKNDREK